MARTILVFHDSYASPQTPWIVWLRDQLSARGDQVIIPHFPTPVGQSYLSWKVLVMQYLPQLNSETIIVGHGTGALFALLLLKDYGQAIGGLVLISPYTNAVPNQGITMVSQTFLDQLIDWDLVRLYGNRFAVLYATGDTFVPPAASVLVADTIGIAPTAISHQGHFLLEKQDFPEALFAIDNLVSPKSSEQKTIERFQNELSQSGLDIAITPEMQFGNQSAEQPLMVSQPISASNSLYQDLQRTITLGSMDNMADVLESERMAEQATKDRARRVRMNVVYAVLGIFVITLGLVMGIRSQRPSEEVTIQSLRDPSPLRAEQTIPLKLPESKVPAILAVESLQKSLALSPRDLALVTLTDETERPIGFSEFMDRIGTRIPASLRATTNGYIFGYYQSADAQPFIILSVDSFDAAYAGMRSWESDMIIDWYRTIVSGSQGFTRNSLENPVFSDQTIASRAVRVAMIDRQTTRAVEETKTETLTEQDIPRVVIVKPQTGITIQDSTLTAKHSALPEIVSVQNDDLVVVPASQKQLGFVGEITAQETNTEKETTTITFSVVPADRLQEIQNKTDSYSKTLDTEGNTIYTKTTTTTKNELVNLEPSAGLYYTFLNNSLVVITTDVSAIQEIARRLGTSRLLRD
jgi:predicted alpha/beta hydrolase family esterase